MTRANGLIKNESVRKNYANHNCIQYAEVDVGISEKEEKQE